MTAAYFTVDGSGLSTLDELLAANAECDSFDADDIATMQALAIGERALFDFGASGIFEVRRVSEVVADMTREIVRLTDCEPRLEWNAELGLFGVWLSIADGEGGEDIIGSGEADSEAFEAALKTVRAWGAS